MDGVPEERPCPSVRTRGWGLTLLLYDCPFCSPGARVCVLRAADKRHTPNPGRETRGRMRAPRHGVHVLAMRRPSLHLALVAAPGGQVLGQVLGLQRGSRAPSGCWQRRLEFHGEKQMGWRGMGWGGEDGVWGRCRGLPEPHVRG